MGIIQDFYDNTTRAVLYYPKNDTDGSLGVGNSTDLNGINECIGIHLLGVVIGSGFAFHEAINQSPDLGSFSAIGTFTDVITSDVFEIINFTKSQRYLKGNATRVDGSPVTFDHCLIVAASSNSLLNFYNNTVRGATLFPRIATATVNGSGDAIVDMTGGKGLCLGIQVVGVVTGTSPTLDGKYQESDDASSWSDISGAIFTQVIASNSLQLILFSRTKQYIRYFGTVGGSSPNFNLASMVFQSTVGGLNERKIRGLNRGLI